MDNPLTFLLIILGLFFTLWLVGGGPSRAISFSGPYITPIADVNDTQDGYGPKITPNASVTLPGGASVAVGTKQSSATTAPKPATTVNTTASTFKGIVVITKTTSTTAQNPDQKYVELFLTSHSSSPVTLSNWKLVSNNGGTVLIKNGTSSNVTLAANQSALIVTTFSSSVAHDTITLFDGSGATVSTVTY